MCTEMRIDGEEITREECWCPLSEVYAAQASPARAEALRALGLRVYEALRRAAEKAPDEREVSVTVTEVRW